MKKAVITILVIVAIVLVVGFVPIVDVPYQDTETYYVDEPYEVVETYTGTMPLSYESTGYVKDDVVKEVNTLNIGGWVTQSVKETPIKVACVDVKNTDTIAGSFTIYFSGIIPLFGVTPALTKKLDLSPDEVKTAVCPADSAEIGDWSYTIEPDTKEVEMERTVTKYRQVEQERLVTHYKKGSIFEYLLSRFKS